MNIQWYPGHMTKTRRMMADSIKLVDIVCEIIDSRIPYSSRNPDIDEICRDKPRLIILNRSDQADPAMTQRWMAYFKNKGYAAIETDCKSRRGILAFAPAVREVLKEKIDRYAEKGQTGRTIKAMIVGIPNVGKSSFINQVAKRKTSKTENRPGVTRGKQWVAVDKTLDLLDTPGILWPKFEDETVGLMLAWTGAIKEDILDIETLAAGFIQLLAQRYPQSLVERYKIELSPEDTGITLLEKAGRKRGFLISGGEVDMERMSIILLDEFRDGKLGKMTLEVPEDTEYGRFVGN